MSVQGRAMNLDGCLTSCLSPPTHGRGKEGRGLGGESQRGMHSVQEWKLHESRGFLKNFFFNFKLCKGHIKFTVFTV